MKSQSGYQEMMGPRRRKNTGTRSPPRKRINSVDENQQKSHTNPTKKLSELPAAVRGQIAESGVFFTYNMANDTHCPRALLMDLEPNVLDDVQNSGFGSLFNDQFFVRGSNPFRYLHLLFSLCFGIPIFAKSHGTCSWIGAYILL